MTIKEQCLKLHSEGLKHAEIARIVGTSRQNVSRICGKYMPGHFRRITEEECVYPIWRNWMNENRMTRTELLRRMGLSATPRESTTLSLWMRGEYYPQKRSIDRILMATGLTYEQLFYRGGEA